MKIKRFIAAALAASMLAGACSCSKDKDDKDTEETGVAGNGETLPDETDGDTGEDLERWNLDKDGMFTPVERILDISGLTTPVNGDNRSEYDFTDKAMEYIDIIGTEYPDRSTTIPHDCFNDWLIDELGNMGYSPEQIERQSFMGSGMYASEDIKCTNVILTVPGEDPTRQIIVGGHYDGDGVGDNGSGVALMLANAAGLAGVTPKVTVKFVFFDHEEEGMIGSSYYASHMSDEEVQSTIYMINIDAILFGDFCNIYGGAFGSAYGPSGMFYIEGEALGEPYATEGYEFATDLAESLGFKVYRPADLDGYFADNGQGMDPEEAFFTNPWTNANPAPVNMMAPSPCAFCASDHAGFAARGIPYIYFEATNWWAEGNSEYLAYTGYPETYDATVGDGGMFMNTEYDTLDQLSSLFPGRAEQHMHMYSPLLSALLLAG